MASTPEKPHERIAEVKRRAEAGLPFLQHSFRPFFLAASIWAALSVLFWLLVYTGQLAVPADMDGLVWHQHEMMFGFAGAAICGFILTAIPNWTGRLPISGWRLAGLAGLWLAGRLGFLGAAALDPVVLAVVDLSFLSTLVVVVLREIVAGKNWRNLPVFVLISAFTAGNWLVHLEATGLTETAALGIRLSIFILAVLVAVIGGRIVPSFTRNWLARNGAEQLPEPMGRFDRLALAVLLVFVVAEVAVPDRPVTAWLALLAAGFHGARLLRWKGWTTVTEPLLWVLHLGYAWLVVALLLIGLAGLTDAVPETAALHALTVGAFGTMILAVMTRTALGHTGRALTASRGTTVIFLMITIAALLRVTAPFLKTESLTVIWLSGLAWLAAFACYLIVYVPILIGPRVSKTGT